MRAPHRLSLLVPVAAAALTAVVLSGCEASVSVGGDDTMSASDLAEAVQDELQANNPDLEVKDVYCDGELEREKGADQVCHGTDALDDLYAVDVIVNGVDDDSVQLGLEPDPGQTVVVDDLVPVVTDELTELSGGTAPDAVDCPDDLRGKVGATVTCVLTAGEDRLETTLTVTSAEGPDVRFDIEVADEPLP